MSLDTIPADGSLPTDQLPTEGDIAGIANAGLPQGDQSTFDQQQAAAEQAAQAQPTTSGTVGGVPTTTTYGTGLGAKIIAAAEHYLGTPYSWGGTGASGIDCSGLVQAAYKAAGIDLPRVSYQQANSGKRVAIGKLRPGDLVAWDTGPENPGADHIAVYLGGGMIIEAAHPGTSVRIRKLGDWSADSSAWGVRMGWT